MKQHTECTLGKCQAKGEGPGEGGRTDRKFLTFWLILSQAEVSHAAQPESAVRVDGAVVAPEALVVLSIGVGGGESRHISVVASGAVQDGNSILDTNQDLVLGIVALDVGGHGHGNIELDRLERVGPLLERDSVHALVDDVDEAETVGRFLIVRAFA